MTYRTFLTATALTLSLIAAAPVAADPPAELVATFDDTRPGNLTVTPAGRIIVSNQPLDGPAIRVREVLADGRLASFPTEDWADGPGGEVGLSAVIGLASTRAGVVWMLDMGGPDGPAQLVGWDSVGDTLAGTIEIPAEAFYENSFLQDFVIDEARGQIVIADMTLGNLMGETRPALIVVDLETGAARRVLERHPSFLPPDRDTVIDGAALANVAEDGAETALRLGLNGIAMGPDGEWIYFGTVSGDGLHRIPTAALADASLDEAALAAAIEPFGRKVPSDGIKVGPGGEVFVTDVEGSTIGVSTADGYRALDLGMAISWPDGFAFGPDGALYVTQNALHLHPTFNRGTEGAAPPYMLLRIAPDGVAALLSGNTGD